MRQYTAAILTTFITLLFTSCGFSSSSQQIKQTTIVGAAVDDYIIGGNISIYNLFGKQLTSECSTKDFGYFSCQIANIREDEKLILVVSGGEINQTPFNGSLAALTQANNSIIISPLTSKLIAQVLQKDLIVDTDNNLSYIEGELVITPQDAATILQNITTLFQAQNNLPTLHLLQTKEASLINEQANRVMQLLDKNISLVNSVDIANKNFRVHIIHINDTHSHLDSIPMAIYLQNEKTYVNAGGYAKIAHFMKDQKRLDSHTFTLLAGDALQGTLYYTLFNGTADIQTLNCMNLDAMTIGNHEFDDGANNFANYFALKANFPILSDDINASNNPTLKDIIQAYIIKKIDDEQIAIVGDTIDSSLISNPGPTIEFQNYLNSAKVSVTKLKDEGINKIIFLTHLGYDVDKFLAQQVEDIDLIVGGHSHTLLGDFSNLGLNSKGPYPTIVKHENTQTLIVTAWKWGMVVGDLTVIFDQNGTISSYNAEPLILIDDIFFQKNQDGDVVEVNETKKEQLQNLVQKTSNIKIESQDDSVVSIIAHYKPEVDKLLIQTIAQAATDLLNVRLPGVPDPDSGVILPHGSMISAHIALSMYEKAKKIGTCDFALQNAGGARISIPQGDITIGEVYTLLPFGNTLVTLQMSGVSIKNMLENAIERSLITKEHTGSFPYLAGAKITIDLSKSQGERIVSFLLQNSNGEWIDFNETQTYNIATNAYIANGGDYYLEMQEAASNKIDTGYIDAEIFIEYAKEKQVLYPIDEDKEPVTIQNY